MDPYNNGVDEKKDCGEPDEDQHQRQVDVDGVGVARLCNKRRRGNNNTRVTEAATSGEAEAEEEVTVDTFAALETPHPYGVLPGGNRFLSSTTTTSDHGVADNGNIAAATAALSLLLTDDECWAAVLGYCDATDLARLQLTGSRYLYVATHQPELWRDLVLRRLHHAQQQQRQQKKKKSTSKTQSTTTTTNNNSNNNVIDTFGSCWKDTYVRLFYKDEAKPHHQHTPIPMLGSVYSDYYYRLHACRAFAIPQAWLSPSDAQKNSSGTAVPQISVDLMTSERFHTEFETKNRPVVIRGACTNWKASTCWSDRDYCQRQTREECPTFRATSGGAALAADFTLPAYHAYCRQQHLEEAPLYLFDRTALRPDSQMWKDYMPDLQRTCPYWDPINSAEHDLFRVLGEGRRPDHTWLIVGPKRSGSVFHIDPNATHAWNATICGKKRWFFYPPGIDPPGVHPSPDGDSVALPLSVGEWLFQFWDEHQQRKQTAPHERPMECTAFPGDVVFVPHGWWHCVINLDERNVAITHNYVSVSNLSNVLKFLHEKRDQVSGCRDRAESIKPDRLYEEFVQALRDRHPEYLRDAVEQQEIGWTCGAWRHDEALLPSKKTERPTRSNASEENGVDDSKVSNNSVMAKAKNDQPAPFSFSFL